MSEKAPTQLTHEQAADIIRYYHDSDNAETRTHGWKDKVSIGQAAVRTTLESHSILPDGKAVLSPGEASKGFAHIEDPSKTDEYYRRWDKIVDKRNIPYDEAKRILDNEDHE